MDDGIKLLAEICEIAGAPGHEQRVRDLVLREIKPLVDEIKIDNFFRKSALYREKWERDSYRNSTINKAIESTTKFYNPENNGYLKSRKNEKKTVGNGELKLFSSEWENTELGIAEKVIEKQGDKIKWCETWKKWMWFNGKHWEEDNEEKHAKNAIENTLKPLPMNEKLNRQ